LGSLPEGDREKMPLKTTKPSRPPKQVVGMAQIALVMGRKKENVAAMKRALNVAHQAGCQLLIFPECCFAGWLSPAATRAAETLSGPTLTEFRQLARARGMEVVLGFEERVKSGVFNSAAWFDTRGEIVLTHRKINELELAQSIYQTGTSLSAGTGKHQGGGLLICADSWVPDLTRSLQLMGATSIYSPCAWAVDPGGELQNIRWIEKQFKRNTKDSSISCFCANSVGVVSEGPWKGKILQGNSLVVQAGKVLFRGSATPELSCFLRQGQSIKLLQTIPLPG
jgi:predicted amidohydrolase